MTSRLTWKELATLQPGAILAFGEVERVYTLANGIIEVPTGTACVIEEQGLKDMWCGLVVRPLDPDLQRQLVFLQDDHNGCIILAGPEQDVPSPFVLDDSCPVECI